VRPYCVAAADIWAIQGLGQRLSRPPQPAQKVRRADDARQIEGGGLPVAGPKFPQDRTSDRKLLQNNLVGDVRSTACGSDAAGCSAPLDRAVLLKPLVLQQNRLPIPTPDGRLRRAAQNVAKPVRLIHRCGYRLQGDRWSVAPPAGSVQPSVDTWSSSQKMRDLAHDHTRETGIRARRKIAPLTCKDN
jgi:hypothetical protein